MAEDDTALRRTPGTESSETRSSTASFFSIMSAQTPSTETAQGWPKSRASFGALIGIFSRSVGPSLAIWANAVQFPF